MKPTTTTRTDWRLALFFVPQLLVVGMVTVAAGGAMGYAGAFLLGVAVALIGTLLFGDAPTTPMEMGCGGIITCVLVAMLIPVIAQAQRKAQTARARAAITAKASPKPVASPSPSLAAP